MRYVQVQNLSKPRRRIDIELEHHSFCGNGPCSCTRRPRAKIEMAKSGKIAGHKIEHHQAPMVLTILSGATATALPDGRPIPASIMKTPGYRAAARDLRCTPFDPPAPPPEVPEPTKDAGDAGPSGEPAKDEGESTDTSTPADDAGDK